MKKHNSVNGISPISGADVSLGTVSHGLQVTPDRHHDTVSTQKKNIRIGTWNIRTLLHPGKIGNVKLEMKRLNVNILGLGETRWKNAGISTLDDCKFIHSGGQKHERGVGLLLDEEISKCLLGYWTISDRVMLVKIKGRPVNIAIVQIYAPTSESDEEDIGQFYEDLDMAVKQCRSNEVLFIMGDLNAKVGSTRRGNIVGTHGLGETNDRGERWIEWCTANDQVILNTWFKEHPRRKYTWRSPDDRTRNQIDYITINNRFRNAVQHTKTYPGADCGSDHIPVVCSIQIKLRKLKKPRATKKLDLTALKTSSLQQQFKIKVQNRYEELEAQENRSSWEIFKEAITTASMDTIPIKEIRKKQKWMTDEILDLMTERRQAKLKNMNKYKDIDKLIKAKCIKEKEKWLNNKCTEIEAKKYTDAHKMHSNIREITGRRGCTSSGCIKSKSGEIIMEKAQVLQRWTEYIKELYEDDRHEEKPWIKKDMQGPRILKAEIEKAINHMKNNKATGPDEIAVEQIKGLGEFGIEKLTLILNEIYNSGEFPEDLSKSIFITLPKKPGAIECELHRTISLINHTTKILLRVLMNRVRNKLKPEISDVQYGFVEDKSTRNAIFIIRMLTERAVEMQKNLYLCFIDYKKAFDKVKHEQLINMLDLLDIDGKDLRVVRNIYWEQTAAIKIDNEISPFIKVKRGVRQGCVFSPDLFNLYSENILREIQDQAGILIGGHNLNNIRYADDIVLIADSEENLQKILDKVVSESESKGLSINCKKTECLVVSKQKTRPTCNITINNKKIKQVDKFEYLGSLITSDAKCDQEINRRIGMAKVAFHKMKKLLCNSKLAMKTKLRVLECYVIPILIYSSECWTISENMKKKVEATEL